MSDSYNIQNSPNSSINVLISKSFEFNELKDQLSILEELFSRTPENNTDRRSQINTKINEQKVQIEQFKKDVLQLAQTLLDIEINTDRLQRTKAFFDKGEFSELRTLLKMELEQMLHEQKILLEERERYKSKVLPRLQNNAEEFLILALSTRFDYSNPNRFKETCEYYENSIKSLITKDNLFQYIYFLSAHGQSTKVSQLLEKFREEITWKEVFASLNNPGYLTDDLSSLETVSENSKEFLDSRKKLAEEHWEQFLRLIALSLHNQGTHALLRNDYDEANQCYVNSLELYRELANKSHGYSVEVVKCLQSIGRFHEEYDEDDIALEEYQEALEILRTSRNTSEYSLYETANTLSMLGYLHSKRDDYNKALAAFEEELKVYEKLSLNNQDYLVDVISAHRHLAILHYKNNKHHDALEQHQKALEIEFRQGIDNPQFFLIDFEKKMKSWRYLSQNQSLYEKFLDQYEEKLKIREQLAKTNPQAFMPDIAATLINLAVFYQKVITKRKESINYVIEAIRILRHVIENVPYKNRYLQEGKKVLSEWSLNNDEIEVLISEKIKEMG